MQIIESAETLPFLSWIKTAEQTAVDCWDLKVETEMRLIVSVASGRLVLKPVWFEFEWYILSKPPITLTDILAKCP